MDTSREINRTESTIQLLRREFERYFVGANDLPPHALEATVLKALQALKASSPSAAELFRINALESRFSSYREMYRRKLKDREEGRSRRPTQRPAVDLPDPRTGVHIEGAVSEQATLSLYRGLYGNSEAPAVGLPQFRTYLEQQVAQIQQRTGCTGIVFRLAEHNGKQRLKAKPVR